MMKIEVKTGELVPVSELTLDQMRQLTGEMITKNPYSGSYWDILTCLRGPDSPSESSNMTDGERSKAYSGRRARKFDGVEIIREAAFFGMSGGGARRHKGDTVTLHGNGDHHDRHLSRAAEVLGLKVKKEG